MTKIRNITCVTATVALAALTSFACGGNSSTPSSPSRAAAALSVASFTGRAEATASGYRYRLNLQLRETGGARPATVTAIEMTLFKDQTAFGSATFDDGMMNPLIPSGGSGSSKDLIVNDDRAATPCATRITATIRFENGAGATASATGTVTLDAPQPWTPPEPTNLTLFGVVRDASTDAPVVGARVSVVDGVNANRSSDTDGNGYYSIAGLRPSSFTLRAQKSGYNVTDNPIGLSADQRFDFTMRASTPAPPTPTPPPAPSPGPSCGPARAPCGTATAVCRDGTYSCSGNRSGTCSSHGGVACWICPGALCSSSSSSSSSTRTDGEGLLAALAESGLCAASGDASQSVDLRWEDMPSIVQP
jgi:hypothetical protein